MRVLILLSIIALSPACAHHEPYVQPTVVYAEPPALLYDEYGMDRVVLAVREALVERGYSVVRVSGDGPSRIVWAQRGPDELVRVFVTPQGRRVAVRSLREVRDRDGRAWVRREPPAEVVRAIDRRLRHRH